MSRAFVSTGRQVQDVLFELKIKCTECLKETLFLTAKLAVNEKSGHVLPLCPTCYSVVHIGHNRGTRTVIENRALKREVVSLINDLRREGKTVLQGVHGD